MFFFKFSRNCNHFSDAFCKRLLDGKSIPNWVNRSANIGSWFSFLAPTVVENENKFQPEQDSTSTVVEKIEISSFDILNCKTKELFSKNKFVESKTDQQLIIFLEFKKPSNLKCISFETKGDDSCPKIVKFFGNKLNLDFENVGQTLENEAKTLEKNVKIDLPLKNVKFKKISNLTVISRFF
jgi:hypothetical protein